MKRKIYILIIAIWAGSIWAKPLAPAIPEIVPPTIDANSHILIDFDSGKVLSEYNSNLIIEPASLTKMMTMYVIDTELYHKHLALDELVSISQKAWKAPGSRMFLEVNSKVPVAELIKGIIIQSGNDASIAIAEHIAGSEEAFAQMMNQYAHQLGMTNSHFVNATGLPEENHYSTAYDMAILSKAIIRDFPESYNMYSEKVFTYNGIKQQNRNSLLWRYTHIDGLKTGQTENAGFCLAASGKVNDMRLIAVVMGAKSHNARAIETNKLLSFGYRFYDTHKVYQGEEPIKTERIWLGNNQDLRVGVRHDLYLTILQGKYKKLSMNTSLPEIIKAPIKKGDILGEVIIADESGKEISRTELIALDEVAAGGIWHKTKDYMALAAKTIWKKMDS